MFVRILSTFHRYLWVISIVTFFFFSFSFSQVSAQGDFFIDLENTYTIQKNDTVHVKQVFVMTNTVSTVYATKYAFDIGSTRIENVRVTSLNKSIEPTLSTHGNKTTVSFPFSDKVIGKDKQRTITVEYDAKDFAIQVGNTIELNIPKLADGKEFRTYTVNVVVDEAHGQPAFAYPSQFVTASLDKKNIITFKNTGQEEGVSLLFGSKQIAKLSLQYHLENTNSVRGKTSIALPSDGHYQRLYYDEITPAPKEITADKDGNWLASYELDPGQRIDITAKAHAVITLKPQEHASSQKPNISDYLRESEHWQSRDGKIERLAKELKTPEKIYDYVVSTLFYDSSRISQGYKRLGALEALENPGHAACLEYSDLFVALSRAAGIPARVVTGYAYSHNEELRPLGRVRDVLHAWPEYWDETSGKWVSVDPTWEDTTGGVDYFHRLDFGHIAFVRQGISSTSPLAAGMYAYDENQTKDIQVEFVSEFPEYQPTYETQFTLRPSALFGLRNSHILQITNTTLQAHYDVPVTVRIQNSSGIRELSVQSSFLPGQTIEIPVQLPHGNIFSNYKTNIQINVAGNKFSHDTTIASTLKQNALLIIVATVVGTSACICAIITRRLLVPRWK